MDFHFIIVITITITIEWILQSNNYLYGTIIIASYYLLHIRFRAIAIKQLMFDMLRAKEPGEWPF